jgi:predicted enzyme related to lactoylglutathione lyase
MAKVTGIGGVFIKSTKDKKALADWYRDNLGLKFEDWGGSIINWKDDSQVDGGMTVWSTAAPDSKWFAPSESSFMINYRVDDLDALLEQLRASGVEIVGDPQTDFNGKFAWVVDPDGNKVELWEPMVAEASDEEQKA